MYLSGIECQFLDVSVTNLNGVQDCYVYIVTHCVPPYVGGGAISDVMLFVRMVSTLTTLMCL